MAAFGAGCKPALLTSEPETEALRQAKKILCAPRGQVNTLSS
jgi:hypothetical protein